MGTPFMKPRLRARMVDARTWRGCSTERSRRGLCFGRPMAPSSRGSPPGRRPATPPSAPPGEAGGERRRCRGDPQGRRAEQEAFAPGATSVAAVPRTHRAPSSCPRLGALQGLGGGETDLLIFIAHLVESARSDSGAVASLESRAGEALPPMDHLAIGPRP